MNILSLNKIQLLRVFLAMRRSFEKFLEQDNSEFMAEKLPRKRKIISELIKRCFPLLVSNHLLRELADEKDARFIQSLSDQLDEYILYFNLEHKYDIDNIERALVDLLRSGVADDLPSKLQIAMSVIVGEFGFHYRYDEAKSLTEGNPSYLDKKRSKKVCEMMNWIIGTKRKWPKFLFGWQDASLPPSDEIKEKLEEKFRMYVECYYGFRFQ